MRFTSMSAAVAALLVPITASAQDYKIGISAGLTGYAATVDRAWRDGVEVAVATLNGKGGMLGRKLVVVTEDNRSDPQESVTVYRKMISSDQVNVLRERMRVRRKLRRRADCRSCTNPHGVVLHPAAAA